MPEVQDVWSPTGDFGFDSENNSCICTPSLLKKRVFFLRVWSNL